MYQLTKDGIIRLSDFAFIPEDPDNRDYAEFMAWRDDGNEPEPAPILDLEIPRQVTMRQARQAMLSAGILAQVDALISAMPGDEGESARIDWNHARDVKRDWPLIGALGPQLGLTEQQIDDLFIYAATVPQ